MAIAVSSIEHSEIEVKGFINGFNEARSLMLAQIVKRDREKEVIVNNFVNMLTNGCNKNHKPSFQEIVDAGCPFCMKSQLASAQERIKELEAIAERVRDVEGITKIIADSEFTDGSTDEVIMEHYTITAQAIKQWVLGEVGQTK